MILLCSLQMQELVRREVREAERAVGVGEADRAVEVGEAERAIEVGEAERAVAKPEMRAVEQRR
jgi:hypothetical protein